MTVCVLGFSSRCLKRCGSLHAELNFREEILKNVVEDAILVRATHKDFTVIKAVNRLLKLLHGNPALDVDSSDEEG